MAIGVVRVNSGPNDLKSALVASGFFSRVEQPTNNNWPVDCYDEDDNLVVRFRWQNGHRIEFQYNNGSSNTGDTTKYASFDVLYYTAHGIMLKTTGSGSSPHIYAVIITKDNNDQYTFIFQNSAADNVYVSIRRSYTGSISAQTFTAVQSNQTALVPFVTLINDGNGRSYTPHAFWIPNSENYNIGWCAITVDGYQYITNGYYALKDVSITA